MTTPEEDLLFAQAAYTAYRKAMAMGFIGWEDLSPGTHQAWIAAARAVLWHVMVTFEPTETTDLPKIVVRYHKP